MRADEARNYLDRATARVVAEDRHLLDSVNVSEWCIAARLAMYTCANTSGTLMSMLSTTGSEWMAMR